MIIGKMDVFERIYIAKFREIASRHGEFVQYERDRAARDIGIHFTRVVDDGSEQVTSAMCWFQLKGLRQSTLSNEEYMKLKTTDGDVKFVLQVNHLKFWYLQPMPTYLVLYIESADEFLIINIQKYVAERWGRDILSFEQESITVSIPTYSTLDDHTFLLLVRNNEIQHWAQAFDADPEKAALCFRDYLVIFRAATAKDRGIEQQLIFRDWYSKLRNNYYFSERKSESQDRWINVVEYWQSKEIEQNLEDMFPYLKLLGNEQDYYVESLNEESEFIYKLHDGNILYGEMFAGEFVDYQISYELNELGLQLYEWLQIMIKARIFTISTNQDTPMIISIAPWHRRAV